jgi:tetratricopeptide (TPR) repeat protein
LIKRGGWYIVPAAFFLLLNFSASEAKGLFFVRLAYFLFLLALFFLCARFRLERILAPISGGMALIVFTYGIIQKFVLFPLVLERIGSGPSFHAQALRTRIASGRVFAIFPLPTLYAMVCGVLLIFIIHYLYRSRGPARLFWALLLFLGAFNLVLTQSFGGIIFFTAGILFYLIVSRVFKAKYLAPLLMVLALVFFLVIALRFSEAREMAPAKLRFANWAQAGRVIASAPALGVGLGNYETAVPAYVFPGEPASIYAHNFFLQMAAEAGLPLFLLLIVVCLPWLKAILPRFLKPENALFASACGLLLFFNLFDVGNFFFAAGISFVVVLSQVVPLPDPARSRHFAIAALLAVPLLVHAAAASRQQAGDLWLSRQEPGRAESFYYAALKFEPFSYRTHLGLAQIAWEKGDLRQAERFLKKVAGVFPGQPYANYRLSQLAQRRGAYLTALALARKATAGNKKSIEYQRWHDSLQDNLTWQSALPGN